MPTLRDSGTVTADGTVQTLTDITDNKYFTFKLDTSAMASGDITTIIISDKVLSGGAFAVYMTETYTDAQALDVKFMAPLWIDQEIKITLQQTAGTNRAYPWSLLQA